MTRDRIELQRPADTPPVKTSVSGSREILLVVAVALVDRDGRVLITRRPEGKPMAGLWEFPGGKVEQGETPERAAMRELWEELGVEPCPTCLAPFAFASCPDGERHLLMPLYICRKWDGIARPLIGQELAWVEPARLTEFAMPPADVPLAVELRDRLT